MVAWHALLLPFKAGWTDVAPMGRARSFSIPFPNPKEEITEQ
jgi:hypothetical protein